jgi:hypothetical protein
LSIFVKILDGTVGLGIIFLGSLKDSPLLLRIGAFIFMLRLYK